MERLASKGPIIGSLTNTSDTPDKNKMTTWWADGQRNMILKLYCHSIDKTETNRWTKISTSLDNHSGRDERFNKSEFVFFAAARFISCRLIKRTNDKAETIKNKHIYDFSLMGLICSEMKMTKTNYFFTIAAHQNVVLFMRNDGRWFRWCCCAFLIQRVSLADRTSSLQWLILMTSAFFALLHRAVRFFTELEFFYSSRYLFAMKQTTESSAVLRRTRPRGIIMQKRK